ncbi:MAG: alpha/beta hydrolase family protein [Marinibacterium sp.]
MAGPLVSGAVLRMVPDRGARWRMLWAGLAVVLAGVLAGVLALAGAAVASAQDRVLAGPLTGVAYGQGQRALVIFLHGDLSGGGAADYLYGDARHAAGTHDGVVAAALLRPGYNDADGQVSPGDANGRRDHYTEANNALLARTIRNMQARIRADRVIVIGHSGGAAQLGAVIGLYPGLVDTAILAGCPCDVPNWRIHRAGYASWPNSVSPLDLVAQVTPGTEVIAIVGQDDSNTLPRFSQSYVQALQAHEVPARLDIVAGGHRYRYLRQPVREALADVLTTSNGRVTR